MKNLTGRVLRIERGSIHDGDGLRTVVFLKGCSLRCAWCAAPESQSFEFEFGYGSFMTVSDVVSEIAKDEIFFFHSGGGVTISGGEPLEQAEFCASILKECKEMGIHTAIETSAFGEYRNIEIMMPYLDLIYADIKLMDDNEHIRWVGASNETILSNIRRISQDFAGKLRIRLPLIPTININDSFIQTAAEFCKSLEKLDSVEFLPYHRLGADTYRKLGRENPMGDVMPPDEATVENAKKLFDKYRS